MLFALPPLLLLLFSTASAVLTGDEGPSLGMVSVDSMRQRVCMERIWPDFQRCRERQREHYRFGRYSTGLYLGSSDVYQPKYKAECCSYWELLECVHRAAKVYCAEDVNLRSLDKFVEMVGLNVPIYICSDEYPKGSLRCRLPSWFVLTLAFLVLCFVVLVVLLYVCIRSSK